MPKTIFSAPRFVILVDCPVSINAARHVLEDRKCGKSGKSEKLGKRIFIFNYNKAEPLAAVSTGLSVITFGTNRNRILSCINPGEYASTFKDR